MAALTTFGASTTQYSSFGNQDAGIFFGNFPDAPASDIYPNPVTIAPVIVAASSIADSAAIQLTGFTGTIDITVTNGFVSVNSAPFVAGPLPMVDGDSFSLRGTANADQGGTSVVSYQLTSGATAVGAGNFVIVSEVLNIDLTPNEPSLNSTTGANVGQYYVAALFNVSGVSSGVDIPIITGDGVQVRIATTQGGVLGAPQTGTVQVRLGYDVMVMGLAVSGSVSRYLSYGGLLLSFEIESPIISNSQSSITPSRVWKIGMNGICQFPIGSELMRGPNGGVRTIKDPDATLDYGIDFITSNNPYPIASAQIIAVGMVAVQTVQNDTFVGFNASGGLIGTRGRVTVRITRSSGIIEDRSINFDFAET